jgi:hypothetical protein
MNSTESLVDALADHRIGTLANTLQREGVPTPEAFEFIVEEDLKETLAEGLNDGAVNYETIRENHGDLVGSTDREETEFPWWLREFEWTVDAEGLDELKLDSPESLDRFENYPEGKTRVVDISLQGGHQFKGVLSALDEFGQELVEQLPQKVLDSNSAETIRSLSDVSIFDSVYGDDRIQTTSEFERWLDDILSLFPPSNRTTTGLLMASTYVQRPFAEEVLPAETISQFEKLGLINDHNRVLNETYHDALETLLNFVSIFDRHVSTTSPDEFEVKTSQRDRQGMAPLTYLFYQSWADQTDEIEGAAEWFGRVDEQRLEQEDERQFADVAFETPLWFHGNRVRFQPWSNISEFREGLYTILKQANHPVHE